MSALIWCPFADEASAAAAAAQLLDERLIACANILPPMRSLYSWQGERGEAVEVAVLFKTDAAVLGWRADTAAKPTAEWLWATVRGEAPR